MKSLGEISADSPDLDISPNLVEISSKKGRLSCVRHIGRQVAH